MGKTDEIEHYHCVTECSPWRERHSTSPSLTLLFTGFVIVERMEISDGSTAYQQLKAYSPFCWLFEAGARRSSSFLHTCRLTTECWECQAALHF